MPNDLIHPISDTAHAIEETAKATAKGIDAVTQGGHYVGSVLGDLPHDLVGMIGDWVKHKRARRWVELQAETDKILRERGVENREELSPSVAIPLIGAAINEDRDVLKQLWAKLLANALDPSRTNSVRPSLIELLKQFDPLDAHVLRALTGGNFNNIITPGSDLSQILAGHLQVTRDDAHLSLEHLYELRCLSASPDDVPRPPVTTKGRALIRAVSD